MSAKKVIHVPASIHKRVKVEAAKRGVSMYALLSRILSVGVKP